VGCTKVCGRTEDTATTSVSVKWGGFLRRAGILLDQNEISFFAGRGMSKGREAYKS
jgi:predicted PhzF superfamily epimerase YddE/YHI9